MSKFDAKPFSSKAAPFFLLTCSSVLERAENKGIIFIFCGPTVLTSYSIPPPPTPAPTPALKPGKLKATIWVFGLFTALLHFINGVKYVITIH